MDKVQNALRLIQMFIRQGEYTRAANWLNYVEALKRNQNEELRLSRAGYYHLYCVNSHRPSYETNHGNFKCH